ncbi:MAG: hypothetical protein EBR40_08500 [Proteobacteria bacterium]|nr:hypothetical protein [Pseudomonadota bacterium]
MLWGVSAFVLLMDKQRRSVMFVTFVTKRPFLAAVLVTVALCAIVGPFQTGAWYHQAFVAVWRGTIAFLRGAF